MRKPEMFNRGKFFGVALAASTLALGGCLYEPSNFTEERVQVEQKPYANTVPVSQFNDAGVREAAMHYRKHGEGPVDLVVTYDPKSTSGGAMQATGEAARISKMLRQNGVGEVRSSIMPVADAGAEMKVLLSYSAYNALAPKDCGLMPGVDTRTVETDEKYKLGCSVETMYARQIARPKDLQGQGASDPVTDGRRASNIVDVYRTGEPNEPLDGESASGDE